MKELLSQNLGLFSVASTPEFSYKVNEDSKHIDNHRTLFLFFGQILAKALFDNIPVNVCLNKSIFKALLGFDKEHDYSNLEDFKTVDYNIYNSLKFIRDNKLKDHEDMLEFYFTTEVSSVMAEALGESTIVDLIPNGSTVRVTDSNKTDFITKKCYYMSYKVVLEQLKSM